MLNTLRITTKLSSHFLQKNIFKYRSSSNLKLSDLDYAFQSITNLNEAFALFHHMLEMKPNPSMVDFTKLFQKVAKLEHYSEVIIMFKELILSGFPMGEYIMNIVINCYARIKDVELCLVVVGFFMKRGFRADVVGFNCMINGLFLKGRIVEAIDLFRGVVRGGECEVDEFTISIVLNGLVKSGYVVNAVELLRIVENREWKIDVVCYNTVIDGLCKTGMLKESVDLSSRMVDRGVVPDVVTYTCLIYGLCKRGKLDLAWRVFDELPSRGICPDVIMYNVMIQGLCKVGRFKVVTEMLERMEGVGCFPNSVTYNVIVQGCLHRRDRFDSIELLKLVVERDFQLDAPSFFVALRQIQGLRQMKGVYDDEVVNNLMRKLIFSCTIHPMRDRNDEYVISSLIHKLNTSDSR